MNMELLKYTHQLDELSDCMIVSVRLYNMLQLHVAITYFGMVHELQWVYG